jgi:hypothetical protein
MTSYILSFLVSLPPQSQSNTFYAKVIGMTDDDSIIDLPKDNIQNKVRLESIACPGHNQATLNNIIRKKKVRNFKDESSFIMHPDSKTEIIDSFGNAVKVEI